LFQPSPHRHRSLRSANIASGREDAAARGLVWEDEETVSVLDVRSPPSTLSGKAWITAENQSFKAAFRPESPERHIGHVRDMECVLLCTRGSPIRRPGL
jgi:hypothetical protein